MSPEAQLAAVTDAASHSQRIKYDKKGNPIEMIDALGQQWLRRYDGSGKALKGVTTLEEVLRVTTEA